jgi:hypothetical protein
MRRFQTWNVGLLHHPRIAASARGHYDVNGHPAFGVDGEFERLQRMEPGELLINARGSDGGRSQYPQS